MMDLLKYPIVMFWLVVSFIAMIISVLLSVFIPNDLLVIIIAVLLSQAASSIFFPILVGYFYEKIKEEESGSAIWRVFKEFSDGGIERIYKDRESGQGTENALNELKKAFSEHKQGDVKLIGVSLRVFFNPTGPFYQGISKLASGLEHTGDVTMRALISHPESKEVINRAQIETPGMMENPLIKRDIALTAANIEHLQNSYPDTTLDFGYYDQAPYCTLVVFPDKCFFSPNLLSRIVPVRLPMIVFRSGSHGYDVLNDYFDHLWEKRHTASS